MENWKSFIPAWASVTGRNPVIESGAWDRLGMVASSLCAIHCICLPWLLVAMPFLAGTLVADPTAERIFVIGSVLLATLCGIGVFRKLGTWWPLILVFLGGATLLTVHATAPPACCARELGWTQAIGSGFGGGFLAASHFVGIRLRRNLNIAPSCGNSDCLCGDEETGEK